MPFKVKDVIVLTTTGTSLNATTPDPTRQIDEIPGREKKNQIFNIIKSLSSYADFEAWRLKIVSLTSERTFLTNENSLLKARIDEVYDSIIDFYTFLKLFDF